MTAAKKFTPEEIKFLEENSATTARIDMARALNRQLTSVRTVVTRLKLPIYEGKYRRWKPAELNELYILAERFGNDEIARKLGRTKATVCNKIRQLGLRTRTRVFSLRSAARATGYTEQMLLRAKAGLGQKWPLAEHGTGPRKNGRYTITEAQLKRLTDWLREH